MRGENFWKGVTVFCLTFGAGFFIAKPFVPDEKPPVNIAVPETPGTLPNAAPETNCVPADIELRYEYLGAKEKTPPTTEARKAETEKREADKKVSKKNPEIRGEAQKPYYIPSRDRASSQILLYRERCFQPEESK
ncbi:MAG: hypothetical protein JSS81_03840 [Acidobacteria bacterium]|nr:hypothetical protein [Acidobacteriota bacterium]